VRVERIILPNGQPVLSGSLRRATCPEVNALCERLLAFLRGEDVAFDLSLLALERCSPFQRAVLLAESTLPRGRVTTYGRLAARLGLPSAARAVGGALSRNPFPLIIPCHRTIRADGALGGFGGGLELKRALLRLEGVAVSADGRVQAPRWAD
jgi:methylated-DNA-[protein]-cysteine S-methyltransferase